MAIRLEKAGWSTAEACLKMQMNWSLWQARQAARTIKVKKFKTPQPA
jgi:plasmid maintenance system antidote protein VapI